jgi:hypothetical protein
LNEAQRTGFSERLKTASDARKALLANFRPKPTVLADEAPDRAQLRAAEIEKVRQARAGARAAKAEAKAAAAEAAKLAADALVASELDARRGERKERKALTKAEQKAKRDARYAARKARQ